MKLIRKEIVSHPGSDTPFIVRYMPWFTDQICINIIHSDFGLLHSHPWNYFTFILWGGYREELKVDGKITVKNRLPGYFSYRNMNQYHSLTPLKKKVITLFIRGKLQSYTKFLVDNKEVRDMKHWKSLGYSRTDMERALRTE